MKQLSGNYRTYQFPSLATVDARETGQPNPHQSGYDDGFKEGSDKGFEKGLSEGHAQGYEDGRKEGFNAGKTAGQEEGFEVFDQARSVLERVQKEIEELRTRSVKEYTDQICQLVGQVSRQVIQAELTLNPGQMRKLAEEALDRMDTDKGGVTIHVSDSDYQKLSEAGINKVRDYPIKADSNLSVGDCRVDTEEQSMTIRSDERIDQCVEQVRQEMSSESD